MAAATIQPLCSLTHNLLFVSVLRCLFPLSQTAFEKGRMAGEMEALRRHEAEAPLKVMQPNPQEVLAAQALANRPDVLEINRLTWVQRLSAVLAELTGLAMIALCVAWLHEYRGNVGWTNSDNNGDIQHYNSGILTLAIGLFLHGNAISNYRMLPLNTSPHINRAWYILLTLGTIVCYILTLTALIMTVPDFAPYNEASFWTVSNCQYHAHASQNKIQQARTESQLSRFF